MIGITADVHLHEFEQYASVRDGFNTRLWNGHDVVVSIAKTVSERGGKSLIVAGDWFHSRRKVSVAVLDMSNRALQKCDELGVKVYALTGNHDLSYDGGSSSIHGQPFEDVWDRVGVHDVDGARVGTVPWTDDPDEVRKAFKKLHGKCDFIVGHFGISGSKIGPSDFEIPGSINRQVVKADCPVFLGHYHKPQKVATDTLYVGSPLQLSWGESGEEKRFILWSKGFLNGYTSHPLHGYPQFIRVRDGSTNKYLPSDFVEIIVDSPEQAVRERRKAEMKGVDAHIVVRDVDMSPHATKILGDTVGEHIRSYMAEVKPPKRASREEVIRVGMSLLEETQ